MKTWLLPVFDVLVHVHVCFALQEGRTNFVAA